MQIPFFPGADKAADVDVHARQIGCRVEQLIQLVAQQQVSRFVRIEPG